MNALLEILVVALEKLVASLKKKVPPPAPLPPDPKPIPVPPPPPPKPSTSRIGEWAKAIEMQEGGHPYDANIKLNNPGNLKYSTLTASWGGQKGFQATDGGWICKFSTFQQGFDALCNFLTLGAENELLFFHDARTLLLFTKKFACPPDDGYANRVAAALRVKVDQDISTFL